MDVIFETPEGRAFSIEVWFFSTVREMKQKIYDQHGFPVARQRLVFNGETMDDDADTVHYGVLQGSRIGLSLDAGDRPAVKAEDPGESRARVVPRNQASRRVLTAEVDAAADTAARRRERVQEAEGIPSSRFALYPGDVDLQDHRALADYGVSDQPEVSVVARPLMASSASSASSSKRLRVTVALLPKNGTTKKVGVEVNGWDNVSELRKALQRVQEKLHIHLPPEGFFFIYKQNVMDEDRTFRWHDVRHGDTIEIFNGSVTGGSS